MTVPPTQPTAERARPKKASDATRTERRRVQRNAQRDPRRQHYLNLAQRIQCIADELTTNDDRDLRSELLRMVNRVRLRGVPPKQKDFEQVLEAIRHHQCHCVEDIHDQTNLPKDVIWQILDGFISMKVLEERGGMSDDTRDEIYTLFFLTGSPAFSPLVLP
jgi:hypothetical protein